MVTFGYTTVFWDWKRWEQEIDRMVLHGINMPLPLTAQEAIMARSYRRMGLSEEEICRSFCGPAHLPWLRMGNISGIDAPLPNSRHALLTGPYGSFTDHPRFAWQAALRLRYFITAAGGSNFANSDSC